MSVLLVNTTDKLQMVTSAAVAVDVHASYMDASAADPPVVKGTTSGRQNTAITTATTTDILAAPAATVMRNLKYLSARNRGAASVDLTVVYDMNGTDFELFKATVLPGEVLEYTEDWGWHVIPNNLPALRNWNTADQSCPASTTTYINGTSIKFPATRPAKIGTLLTWEFSVTKTAAGTASKTMDVRFGTLGTTGDTSRLAFTIPAGTAVVDTGQIIIRALVRGPISTICVVEGMLALSHNLATTGLANLASINVNTTSAAFDITTADIIAGVSLTTGASEVWNFELVNALCEGV